jgi:2-polyprenyl-3-methyl-5-hydroxy-6-metoxy-1,4-benzoquinol methylase
VTPSPEIYLDAPTLRALNKQLAANARSWPKTASCPVCAVSPVIDFGTIRGIQHTRCTECGFIFANPVPTREVLHAFYNSPFYSNYRHLEERRISRDRYYSISMYTEMSRLAGWLGEDKAASILDYGCGPGAFLAYLRDKFGFSHVEGLEINKDSIEIAKRNFDLNLASHADQLQRANYDFVLLLEVIEHVPLPDAFLRDIAAFVKPGGRILITTPAVDNVLGRFLPSHCPHFTAPSHVSLFTKRALTRILERLGFRIERMEIDEAVQLAGPAFGSLLYDLDFASPKHDDDTNDQLFVPTALGRLLGLRPGRQTSIGARLGRLDRWVARAAKLLPMPRNNHLYTLARKIE